jgi:hypothetical protein
MKTYSKIFIRASVLFISTLTLTNSSWAEAIPGTEVTSGAKATTPDTEVVIPGTETVPVAEPKPKKIRICTNSTNSQYQYQIELRIWQISPQSDTLKEIFTLSNNKSCHDVPLNDIIDQNADSNTVHWIAKNNETATIGHIEINKISLCTANKITIAVAPSGVGDTTPLITTSTVECPLQQAVGQH